MDEFNFQDFQANFPIDAYGSQSDVAAGFIMGGILVYSLVVAIVVYVVMAIALMKIAQKTGFAKTAWFAWIPILNIILMLNVAGMSGWYIFLFLLGIIPFLGWLFVIIFTVYVWMKISKACGKPDYLGLLMVVPLANLILPLYLAFSD